MGLTKIVWDDHFTTLQSPTFMSQAENIVVRNISFVNSYNYPDGGRNRILPAAAALVNGDKTSFYGCGFFSVQDTLWDNEGRHYFKDCIIEGAVDFIFGRGQSIYEGRGPSYLGRPWRQYARVLFYKCKLSDIVEPKGWNPWNGDMNKVTFSEYGNFGPGADTSKRVGFEKLNLPIQVWMEMTSISYINKDGWLERQPR
ncbi:Probable pectinesterase 29 [Linum grandiflorum]